MAASNHLRERALVRLGIKILPNISPLSSTETYNNGEIGEKLVSIHYWLTSY
jgi:hypothetical protein